MPVLAAPCAGCWLFKLGLAVGCWVLGLGAGSGCWVLGAGCWVLGAGCWVLVLVLVLLSPVLVPVLVVLPVGASAGAGVFCSLSLLLFLISLFPPPVSGTSTLKESVDAFYKEAREK
ncbi:hypothetical protein M405DRAFT_847484 [Rhizopogon salebrosus TDB-379]|nr:hypothetical protein M405DRAFT_847484 [Rhizopogon salebrosus TDB-379]